jgi:hypothetical protein
MAKVEWTAQEIGAAVAMRQAAREIGQTAKAT